MHKIYCLLWAMMLLFYKQLFKGRIMSFDKQTVVDRIEVMADHTIAVRYVVTVTEDGQPFAV